MKNNVLFLLALVFILSASLHAQRGVRIGYIDTEFILENIPEYQDATIQLNDKANSWKIDIEEKLNIIEQKRKDLSIEKVLLTSELIKEREEDITFEEREILDYQQKRFGPNGDLFIQKKQLMQPIQDQIFSAVQDIADSRQYDYIFDKASDAVMLYSAKQYDLSEQIIRSITRSSKRTQAEGKAQRRIAEEEELNPEINYKLEAREKELEDRKAERESIVDKRRQEIIDAREARVKAAEDRRQQILDDREKAKQDKLDARNTIQAPEENKEAETKVEDTKTRAQLAEDRRLQILKEREEARQEKLDARNTIKAPEVNKAVETNTEVKTKAEETKTQAQLIEENRQKKLAEREARKQELEERRKKILEERQQAIENRK